MHMDAVAYRRASLAIWEAMAPGWDERHAYFEQVARPVTDLMLERLDPRPGETILELAAGSGVVGFAAALAEPGCRVMISDFARGMVEAARLRGNELGTTNCEYRVLDGESLDLPDDSVDGVLCRWGYMLMADPARALRETRRVLRPGGGVACAVFAGPDRNPWAAVPGRILVERGHIPPPAAGTPGPLALADVEHLRVLFAECGFGEPRIDEVDFSWTFADEDDYWDFLVRAAGAVSMVLTRLDEEERTAVRSELGARVSPYAAGGGLALPGTSLVVAAS